MMLNVIVQNCSLVCVMFLVAECLASHIGGVFFLIIIIAALFFIFFLNGYSGFSFFLAGFSSFCDNGLNRVYHGVQ